MSLQVITETGTWDFEDLREPVFGRKYNEQEVALIETGTECHPYFGWRAHVSEERWFLHFWQSDFYYQPMSSDEATRIAFRVAGEIVIRWPDVECGIVVAVQADNGDVCYADTSSFRVSAEELAGFLEDYSTE